jgi:hypothetical protein
LYGSVVYGWGGVGRGYGGDRSNQEDYKTGRAGVAFLDARFYKYPGKTDK